MSEGWNLIECDVTQLKVGTISKGLRCILLKRFDKII